MSFHGASLPPIDLADRPDRGAAAGRDRAPAQAEDLHPDLRRGAGPPGGERCAHHRHHRRHADRHRPCALQRPLPGAILRRRHRRAARGDAGDRAGPRRDAAGRGAVLDVQPARLRRARPRRLPERRAGAARRWTDPAWSARTAPPTRACSCCRPCARCRTSSIGSPKDEQELRDLVVTALAMRDRWPCSTRATPARICADRPGRALEIGRGEVLREGCRPAARSASDRSSSACWVAAARGRWGLRPPSSTPAGRSRSDEALIAEHAAGKRPGGHRRGVRRHGRLRRRRPRRPEPRRHPGAAAQDRAGRGLRPPRRRSTTCAPSSGSTPRASWPRSARRSGAASTCRSTSSRAGEVGQPATAMLQGPDHAPAMPRIRLDQLLTERGLARSRGEAQALIHAGDGGARRQPAG